MASQVLAGWYTRSFHSSSLSARKRTSSRTFRCGYTPDQQKYPYPSQYKPPRPHSGQREPSSQPVPKFWDYGTPRDYRSPPSYGTPPSYGSPVSYGPSSGQQDRLGGSLQLSGGNGGKGGGGRGDGGGRGGGGGGGGDGGTGDRGGRSMSQNLTLLYAAIVAVGGVIGFVKGGSKASLALGLLFGAALYYINVVLAVNPHLASGLGMAVSLALLSTMAPRFFKTKKVFPAGVLSVVSFIMSLGYAHGLLRDAH